MTQTTAGKARGTEALEQLSVQQLQRVGPRVAERLAKLGVTTISDLLLHLPIRYQDRTRVFPIASLYPGQEALVQAEVHEATVATGRRRSLRVWVSDASGGALMLRFFHFSAQQVSLFTTGVGVRCYGEVRQGPQGLEMVHPEYRLQDADGASAIEATLTPVYPATEGLSQTSLRGLIEQALVLLEQHPLAECLPQELGDSLGLPQLDEALDYLHRPPREAALDALLERRHPACQRLAFEELVAHQVSLRRLREHQRALAAPCLHWHEELAQQLRASLPFALTSAQERVVAEIRADLERTHPMQRLLQGDVGAGKTVVAACAALQAIGSGFQVALMAPTELLAEQHYRTLTNWLAPLGLETLWLTGRHKGRERAELLARIASGQAALAIGTHALFQEDVEFRALGLVVIDEQHRFGVHQRLQLRDKGRNGAVTPHQLIMTATPIPRSLAMTWYADLDLSIIDTLPPGRTPVTTAVLPDSRRDEVIERVRQACLQGRQVYWVCTLIEESEALQCQAAEDAAEELQARLEGVRVGLVHGRLRGEEREVVMTDFAAGNLDLLVATTVIEVGVDVPNASLMIIENPERLGLSQLHQLRGRVGRGAVASHCLLLYHAPLSATARERLATIRGTTSGFEIAERDLQLRGAGEVLGTRQTGTLQLRIADPMRDQGLVEAARQVADRILREYPQAVAPLIRRWLGDAVDYGGV